MGTPAAQEQCHSYKQLPGAVGRVGHAAHHARLCATADGEAQFEDISAHLLSRRGIPISEKIEVTPSL
jgi:hypothetical protein